MGEGAECKADRVGGYWSGSPGQSSGLLMSWEGFWGLQRPQMATAMTCTSGGARRSSQVLGRAQKAQGGWAEGQVFIM